MVVMTNTAELEKAIQELGLKNKFIADQLGISQQSFIDRKKGRVEFKGSELDKMRKILRISSNKRMQEIFFANDVELNATEENG